MGTKLTVTTTRPDENIPFFDQTPAWENDTELQEVATKHNNLVADGIVTITGFHLDPLTKITEFVINDLAAYSAAMGFPPGPLPKTQFSETTQAYNDLHGITIDVVEEEV